MQPGDIFTDYEQRMQRLPVFDNLESDNAKALPCSTAPAMVTAVD